MNLCYRPIESITDVKVGNEVVHIIVDGYKYYPESKVKELEKALKNIYKKYMDLRKA